MISLLLSQKEKKNVNFEQIYNIDIIVFANMTFTCIK